jgi:hypothetical protein
MHTESHYTTILYRFAYDEAAKQQLKNRRSSSSSSIVSIDSSSVVSETATSSQRCVNDIGDSPQVPGLPLPCTKVAILARAERRERCVLYNCINLYSVTFKQLQ